MQRTSVMDLRIGSHCKFPGCQQLDFLPFVCTSCHDSFCLDHRAFAAHNCVNATADRVAPDCPKCSQVVPLLPDEEPMAALQKHIAAGCKSTKIIADGPRCQAPGCRTRHNNTPVTCSHCHGKFCIQHRVAEDHQCARKPAVVAPSRPTRGVVSMASSTKTMAKSAAELVAPNTHKDDAFSIRLWLAAVPVESVPASQRHRLNVQPIVVQLNRRWSVGKAVDWICSQFSIRNDASSRYRLVALHQPPQVVSNNLVLSQSARWNDDGTQSPDLGHEAGVALVPETILSSMNQQNLQRLVSDVQATVEGQATLGRRCAEEVRQFLTGMLPSFAVTARAG